MAIGILAARSNSNIAAAAITSAQADVVQAQLAFTRDFEREATTGWDIRRSRRRASTCAAWATSSGDCKRQGACMRTMRRFTQNHPLTLERISDMQNRAQLAPYRQVMSDLDFFLVRAKLRAQMGTPRDASPTSSCSSRRRSMRRWRQSATGWRRR